ncbi:MAG TPA: hypothetical protein PLX97_01755, partial [Gemmatales bacterium]|nr:hypothetical protein [Gemmatales bacterium]
MRPLLLLSAACLLTCAMQADESSRKATVKLEYNRDIRPILAENCFACHGPDSAARKGGLRLDQRDAALKKKA